jgi:D-alanine-D-alanine ligase
MATKHSIIVFTGGYSGEAAISRKSARMVMNHIDSIRFQPTLVHINDDGWFIESDGRQSPTTL